MVRNYFYVLAFVCFCQAFPSEYNTRNHAERRGHDVPVPSVAFKRTWTLANVNTGSTSQPYNEYPSTGATIHSLAAKNTKKSDMPEKGQIKFMKTLLGKVKTLLNHKKNGQSHSPAKTTDSTKQVKISSVTSSDGKLYGVVGDNDGAKQEEETTGGSGETNEKEDKSVNVISIPVKALAKMAKSEPTDSEVPAMVSSGQQNEGAALQGSANGLGLTSPLSANSGVASFVPVILQPSAEEKGQGGNVMLVNPQTRAFEPAGFTNEQIGQAVQSQTLPRLFIQRHGNIAKHAKNDDNLYRDIGHIPGESKFHNDVDQPEDAAKTSVRHKRPGAHTGRHPPRVDNDGYYDDDDDDDYDDDDDDDYNDDDDDDNNDNPTSRRMRAEQREIAATRKRLYAMLPGNDPTYTSENRGLGLMRPFQLTRMPEAFLGNPMLGGTGFGQSQIPFASSAMLGEHADNANDRGAFLLGNHGQQRFYDGTTQINNDEYNKWDTSPTKVGANGFSLGGSPAQALSSNEVSYLVQKSPGSSGYNRLLQKDMISRPRKRSPPHNVLLQVDGHPIGDSQELRSHVVNGRITKGKEKIIKSKGPVDVKITKATDGVHSKVVNITSSSKDVKVLEAKSHIAKNKQ